MLILDFTPQLSKFPSSQENYGSCIGGGGWLKSTNSGIIESFNPSTGELLAKVFKCSKEDYEIVIKKSEEAFIEWRKVPAPIRGQLILDMANELRLKSLFQRIKKITKNKFNNIQIGLLGISFKPNTDDVRESPGLKLAKDLSRTKAKIKIYDPKGMENAKKELPKSIEFCNNEYEVAENSNLLVIVTEWNEFKSLDLLKIKKLMKKPVILDLRNIYSKEITKNGFKYYSIGNN